jgi:hypothetical protein
MTRADLPYLMGILFIALGAFGWAISGILSRVASSSYVYLRPGRDREAFRRKNSLGIRLLGTFFILIGIGIIILQGR